MTVSDLIRRSDAMGAVQDHFNADGFKGYDDGQQMMDRIKALPSAEAVQGKWETAYLDHEAMGERPSVIYCSRCNHCFAYKTNFCPNCGADMRGGESDE